MPGRKNNPVLPKPPLELSAYVKLMRAAGSVTARVHGYLAAEGVSISQFGVLEALLHCGPLQQCELGQKILKSSGNMTVVIDNLERRGLVARARHTVDRRRITIYLTEAGRELVLRLFPLHLMEVSQAMQALSAAELEQLARLCKKLGIANAAALAAPRQPQEEVLCD